MKTEDLRINQLSAEGYDWYLSYLAALDAKDIDRYGAFLADGCVLQMNNDEPVQGRDAVLQALAGFWSTFGTLEHDLLSIYGTDRAFCLEALNHFTRLDGRSATLRAVAFIDRDESGLITSVRLYADTAPLFAP